MASPSQDGTLKKGTTLTFISHLNDHQAEESDSTHQHLPNNLAAPAAAIENPPEDT